MQVIGQYYLITTQMLYKFKELIEKCELVDLVKLIDSADSTILSIIIKTENEVLNGKK
jgi:hypothetical protein